MVPVYVIHSVRSTIVVDTLLPNSLLSSLHPFRVDLSQRTPQTSLRDADAPGNQRAMNDSTAGSGKVLLHRRNESFNLFV